MPIRLRGRTRFRNLQHNMLHRGEHMRCASQRVAGPPARQPRARVSSRAATSTPAGSLQTNPLGSSGMVVTDVCMGTMTFGEQNTEAEAHEMLSYAAECGVNFIDTAEVYPVAPRPETSGYTSTIVGNWLATQRRDKFIIASKVAGRSTGLDWVPGRRSSSSPSEAPSNPKLDGKSIIAAAEAELRRLRTDHIDLFQLHWPDRYIPLFGQFQYRPEQQVSGVVPFTEQVEAMGQLMKQGKVRAWGLSNESAFGVMSHCAAAQYLGVPPPVTLQNHYSLLQRTYEGDLAETCLNLGIGLLPWSPLAGGALSGKYLNGQAPKGSRFELFAARYARFNTPRVHRAVAQYVGIARDAGMEPEQLAYAFCRSRWFVPSTIIGATSMQQLRSNLAAFMGPAQGIHLTGEVLQAIEQVHNEMRNPALVD